MLRKFFCFLFFAAALWANEALRIYSYEIEATKESVKAKKRVVVEYKDYYIEADRAEYEKEKKLIKLFGNISLIKDATYSMLSDFALLDLQNEVLLAKPIFFNEFGTKTWIGATSANAKKKRIDLSNAFISSCDVRCSDWRLYFQKGTLDQNRHWVDLYGVKFFAGDRALFYLPYIGFSTLKQRHSGLLRPKIGLSQDEGLVYLQPIYFAPDAWWDLEVEPQIRTKRGYGLYSTFRFVDSLYSFGSVRLGFFDEKSGYVERKNLKNDKHYGVELFYKRKHILTPVEDIYKNDGLYVDIKNYNDVDYFNLQKNRVVEGIESQITSRVNYVYNYNKHYFAIYTKYFKDNRKVDNSDTLQLMPALHYHKYETPIFNDHFSYNVDFIINHYYRDKGLNAIEYKLNIPVRFYYSFFDNYLGFSISENLFADYADYNFVEKDLNKKWKNSYIYRNDHGISFFSDLVKRYPGFLHTVHLDATFFVPSFEKTRGDQAPFINIQNSSKKIVLSLQQYFYQNDTEKFYHRLSQPIFYEEPDKFGDLENEFGIELENIVFNTDIFYSHTRSTFTSLATTLSYRNPKYELFLSHFYKNRVKGERDSNFLRFMGSSVLSKKYKLFATIDFDIKDNNARSWSVGWSMHKSCWAYEISYKKEVLPILSSEGSRSYENNVIFFRIEFYPLGGIANSIIDTETQKVL